VLLYIVPCLFIATYVTAIARNEWSRLWTIDVNKMPIAVKPTESKPSTKTKKKRA